MAIWHSKSATEGDFTGTVTVYNSQGSTVTAAATDLVRPSDWNSAHYGTWTISGTTSGTSTAAGSNYVLAASNGMTLSHSTGAGAATLWMLPPVSDLTVAGNLSLSTTNSTVVTVIGQAMAVAVSNTTLTSGTVVFSNSNNVSFGLNGSTITASASGGGGGVAVAGSNATYTSGTAVFTGSNAVTVKTTTGQAIVIDAPTQTQQPMYYSASGTSTSSNTLQFSNSNGVTWGLTNGAVIATVKTDYQSSNANYLTSQSNQAASGSNGSFTFQTLSFSNANGMSFGTSAGSAMTASYTVPTQTNQQGSVYASSNTFGTSSGTYDARSLSIAGSGAVGVAASNSGWVISAPSQTNQAGNLYAISQSTGTSSGTYDARTLSIAGDGIISVAASNSGFRISATVPAQTAESQTIGVFNTTAGGGTGGTTGSVSGAQIRYVFVPGSNITMSQSTNGASGTISIYGPTPGAAAITQTVGVSNLTQGGNTAGTTGGVTGDDIQYVLVPGSNITMSQSINGSSGTLTIYGGGGGGGTFSAYAVSNTFGTSSGTGQGTMSIAGDGLASVAASNSGWRISVPATQLTAIDPIFLSAAGSTISIGYAYESYFRNIDVIQGHSTMVNNQSTSCVVPFVVRAPLSIDFIRFLESGSNQAASTTIGTSNGADISAGLSRTINFVIYSRGTGANSMSIQSFTSTQITDRQSIRVSANATAGSRYSVTLRQTFPCSTGVSDWTNDYSASQTNISFTSSGITAFTGRNQVDYPFALTIGPGHFWLAYGISTTLATSSSNAGSRLIVTLAQVGVSQFNSAYGLLGVGAAASVGPQPGIGSFSTAGGGTTASIPLANISSSASQNMLYFQLMRIA